MMQELLKSPVAWLVGLTLFIGFLLLIYVLMYRVMKHAIKEVTKDAIYEVVYEAIDWSIKDVNWNVETVLNKSKLDLNDLNHKIEQSFKLNQAIYKMLDDYIYEDEENE